MGGGPAVASNRSWQELLIRVRGTGYKRWLLGGVAILLLGMSAWASSRMVVEVWAWWLRFRETWMQAIREAMLWIEFFGSISISLIVLSWTTMLLFGLLALLVYLLPFLIRLIAWLRPSNARLAHLRKTARQALRQRDRLVGTLLNLAASGGALWAFSWMTQQPLDYWDVGIQCLIALALELIVLGVVFGGRPGRTA